MHGVQIIYMTQHGNYFEWTQEGGNDDARTVRGGDAIDAPSYYTKAVSDRNFIAYPYNTDHNRSSRVVLYIK